MALFIIANKSLALKEDNKDLFREAMDKKLSSDSFWFFVFFIVII